MGWHRRSFFHWRSTVSAGKTVNGIRFKSTRGGSEYVGMGRAIEMGLARDGGLFVPDTYPDIHVRELPGDSFLACSQAVFQKWFQGTEFESDVDDILEDALNFPVPLARLSPGVHVMELFHGPTLSFKDFGARIMARLLGKRLQQSGKQVLILVATSGDTGSAVADGFSGVEGVKVVLLYPKGQVSPIQEQQLTIRREGVHALRVDGSFDDCQRLVKSAFNDQRFEPYALSSANSINIGRLIPQMLYYFWAARQLGSNGLRICVPSGNLGNLTAGVLAAKSGMSQCSFIAAHNRNDYFPEFLRDSEAPRRPSVSTLSNAMDVGAPSNLERLKYLLNREEMTGLIEGVSVNDADTISSIQRVHRDLNYLVDPHTAVSLEALCRSPAPHADRQNSVVLATAHPAKFPEIINNALGIIPEEVPSLKELLEKETSHCSIQPDSDELYDAVSGLIDGS